MLKGVFSLQASQSTVLLEKAILCVKERPFEMDIGSFEIQSLDLKNKEI